MIIRSYKCVMLFLFWLIGLDLKLRVACVNVHYNIFVYKIRFEQFKQII